LDLFFVLVGTAHSLTLDLGYDFVNVTSRSQKELGYDNLFRVENIDMGSAVIVSIRNIPETTPNADVRAQAVLRVVNTNDQTRIRAPLLVEKGQVVVTLEKGLWENAFVDLYVVWSRLTRDKQARPTPEYRSFDICTGAPEYLF
jgi:hypothetical protein